MNLSPTAFIINYPPTENKPAHTKDGRAVQDDTNPIKSANNIGSSEPVTSQATIPKIFGKITVVTYLSAQDPPFQSIS